MLCPRTPRPSAASVALVTGASAGIGTEIATELAVRGHGLVLVSRRKPRSVAIAEELAGKYGVRAEAIAAARYVPHAIKLPAIEWLMRRR